MAKRRSFTWGAWDFDGLGGAFIVAKSECPVREEVPDYIVKVDNLDPMCAPAMEVEEGWCMFQVRGDWDGMEGERRGSYLVLKGAMHPLNRKGTPMKGCFPVWIVRKGEWY